MSPIGGRSQCGADLQAWTRLILPNGRSIALERQPNADAARNSELEDELDNHRGSLFKAALMSPPLSVGAKAGTGSDQNSLIQALRKGAGVLTRPASSSPAVV